MNSGSIGMAKFSLLELVHPQQGETFQPGHPTNIKKWFSNSSAVQDYLDVFFTLFLLVTCLEQTSGLKYLVQCKQFTKKITLKPRKSFIPYGTFPKLSYIARINLIK